MQRCSRVNNVHVIKMRKWVKNIGDNSNKQISAYLKMRKFFLLYEKDPLTSIFTIKTSNKLIPCRPIRSKTLDLIKLKQVNVIRKLN
jgi:hypothetical protein